MELKEWQRLAIEGKHHEATCSLSYTIGCGLTPASMLVDRFMEGWYMREGWNLRGEVDNKQ